MEFSSGLPLPLPAARLLCLRRAALPLLRQLARLRRLQRVYNSMEHCSGLEFVAALLAQLRISVQVEAVELRRVPITGAFVAVASQPASLLSGLVLLHVLGQVRPELRAVANDALQPLLTQLRELVLVQSNTPQFQRNAPGVRKLLRFLQNDVPLLLFPAGAGGRWPLLFWPAGEPEWSPAAERLLLTARVPVLPVWLSRPTKPSFNWLGLLSPFLPTLRLPAELLNGQNTTICVRLGQPLLLAEQQRFSPTQLLSFFRARVQALGSAARPEVVLPCAPPVAAETSAALITAELAALRPKRRVLVNDFWDVYVAQSHEIPCVLREIGRLRELTLRDIGKGTQQPTHLDSYDACYHHLFLYDRRAGCVAGACRVGPGHSILRQHGRRGFSLHSLFRLKKGLKPLLNKSLELGRLFIRPEYQHQPLPPLLFWKGIATYLTAHPRYQYLIGSVSITNPSSPISKAAMVSFIRQHCFDEELASYVQPRRQFCYRPLAHNTNKTVSPQRGLNGREVFEYLIGALELGGLGVPEALRHYIRQNARFVGFHLNPEFSNALNGFVVLEASNLPERTRRLLDQ